MTVNGSVDEKLLASYPLHVFNFLVEFTIDSPKGDVHGGPQVVCRGAFSECTGLEATMEPKVIKEGGRNFGAVQRPGPVTFATVILKRGMTRNRDLWHWFNLVNGTGKYAYRLSASITMFGPVPPRPGNPPTAANPATSADANGQPVLIFKLARALPIKFKAADLNARGTEVGIEELHLAHEGLTLEVPSGGKSGGTA